MTTVSIKNIASAIHESSKGREGKDFDTFIENSVKLIAKKNLLSKSEQILSHLNKLLDKDNGIIRAKISSKEKISDKNKEEIIDFIKKRFSAKEVILELKEDLQLLGGIKIEIEDEIIDTTLRHKLNLLQNHLKITQ